MSIEINDLNNIERNTISISDLSSNAIDLICIDNLMNIPLVKGAKGDKGDKR